MSNAKIQGTILTIRRPSGVIEEVLNTTQGIWGSIGPALFAQIVKATKDAGRGDILSQRPNVASADTLADERATLVGRLQDLSGGFPGASKAAKQRGLEASLAAFDGAHPEVVAAISAAREARVERSMQTAD